MGKRRHDIHEALVQGRRRAAQHPSPNARPGPRSGGLTYGAGPVDVEAMTKGRLEAFSDGVIAILITIMVLELKVPHGTELAAIAPLLPVLLSYVLSFIFVGIYWNNHHHLLHAATKVNGAILWANLHLLFWLSLVPLVTGWIGETHLATIPTAAYGTVLLASAIAFTVLQKTIIAAQGPSSPLAKAVGPRAKEMISLILYVAAIPAAFVEPWISAAMFVLVAALWLVPDRRIEALLSEHEQRS
jgi:uncharacterized membrane protein